LKWRNHGLYLLDHSESSFSSVFDVKQNFTRKSDGDGKSTDDPGRRRGSTEFPELANRFNIRGVPQTVINSGAGSVVGAVPEQNLMAEIIRALQN
jgi:hypothetical protein